MKEQWILESEQSARNLAEDLYYQIIKGADDMYIDRQWYFEKVIQYMKEESEIFM